MVSNTQNLTDEDIVLLVIDGDIDSFGVLVERYQAKLLRYARKLLFNDSDAEDIIQEIFIKTYQNINSFDAAKKFSPWIYRIAHNEIINKSKRRKFDALPFFDADTLWPHPVSAESPTDDIDQKLIKEMLDQCLEKLAPKYREPMILYYLEELSYKEIADILHIPTSTVGIRIKRGKEKLQKECKTKTEYEK